MCAQLLPSGKFTAATPRWRHSISIAQWPESSASVQQILSVVRPHDGKNLIRWRATSPFMRPIEKERKMAKVKIEKFIDGKHETSFSVPAFVLGMAKTLLPESALSSLANSGINVREILEAKHKQHEQQPKSRKSLARYPQRLHAAALCEKIGTQPE